MPSDTKQNRQNNNHEPAHPIRGFFLLALLAAGLLWLTSYVPPILGLDQPWRIGDNTFTIQWWVYVFPVAFVLLLALRLLDAISKGWVFEQIGQLVAFGFPSFGQSLRKLRLWYLYPDQQKKEYEQTNRSGATHLQGKHIFSMWMIAEMVPKYENNVQAMAYWGAAILIVFVGFRGIQLTSREDPSFIIAALLLEFLLISLLGFMMFYKPEGLDSQHRRAHDGNLSAENLDQLSKTVSELQVGFEDVRRRFDKIEQHVKEVQDQIHSIKTTTQPR